MVTEGKGKKVKTNQQKSMTFEPYSSLNLVFSPPVLSSEVLFGVRTAKGYTASSSSSSCLGWGGSGLATPKNCVIKFIEQQQAVQSLPAKVATPVCAAASAAGRERPKGSKDGAKDQTSHLILTWRKPLLGDQKVNFQCFNVLISFPASQGRV